MVATIALQVSAAGLLTGTPAPRISAFTAPRDTAWTDSVERARVIRIHGARHYIFLTHPAEVTHTMLEFLSGS